MRKPDFNKTRDIDNAIRDLLAESHSMVGSDETVAAKNELIQELLACAKRADAVHYLYSAQLLRTAAETLRKEVNATIGLEESARLIAAADSRSDSRPRLAGDKATTGQT